MRTSLFAIPVLICTHLALAQQPAPSNAWFEGPGSHEWQVWRKHLNDIAPRLFQ